MGRTFASFLPLLTVSEIIVHPGEPLISGRADRLNGKVALCGGADGWLLLSCHVWMCCLTDIFGDLNPMSNSFALFCTCYIPVSFENNYITIVSKWNHPRCFFLSSCVKHKKSQECCVEFVKWLWVIKKTGINSDVLRLNTHQASKHKKGFTQMAKVNTVAWSLTLAFSFKRLYILGNRSVCFKVRVCISTICCCVFLANSPGSFLAVGAELVPYIVSCLVNIT